MSVLAFDESTHTYLLDGVKIPSVTQILKPLYDFSAVHPDVLRRAGEFGTALHKAVELYLRDDLDESSLDENLVKPLDAFKSWQRDDTTQRERLYLIETPDYHAKLKYAGTPDLTCSDMVIDIKSRPVNLLTDPLQLVAYDRMGPGNRAHYVLELKQDGTYQFTRVNPTKKSAEDAWSRFRYLLDYYNAGQEIARWRN